MRSPISPICPIRPICLIALIALLLSSCQRYELEHYYSGRADVTVTVDWESRFGERPTGMTIMLAKDGDSITFTDVTNQVDTYTLELEPGTYKMLIFNLTTSEFGSMRFAQTKSFNDIFAFANQLQRTTDFWDVNCYYMREPEPIGCVCDTFTVLPEMAEGGDLHFVNYREPVPEQMEGLQLHEVVEPMTTQLYVRVKVLGIKYMAGVIGNISGLADGFLLTQAWRRSQTAYHLLDNWQRTAAPTGNTDATASTTRADSTASVGYIETKVSTFGLPHGRELPAQRDSMSNVLSLCFTLIDDTRHVFRYPVGKAIHYRDRLDLEVEGAFRQADVTLELNLLLDAPFYDDDDVPNLPYAQPTGTGAFDAEVAPWGDDETVEVPMMSRRKP